jgi:hypothetical protein
MHRTIFSFSHPLIIHSSTLHPISQARLLALFQRTDPSGLTLVSGDVHAAELSAIKYARADGSAGQWVEVTSSGLTHTCVDNAVTAVLCPLMMGIYSAHRQQKSRSGSAEDGNNDDVDGYVLVVSLHRGAFFVLRIALRCFALPGVALRCFALRCFALLCVAMCCLALLCCAMHSCVSF